MIYIYEHKTKDQKVKKNFKLSLYLKESKHTYE